MQRGESRSGKGEAHCPLPSQASPGGRFTGFTGSAAPPTQLPHSGPSLPKWVRFAKGSDEVELTMKCVDTELIF